MGTAFSDKEREELLLQLKREMEDEHNQRLEEFRQRRQKARVEGQAHRSRVREEEVEDLRRKVRDEFLKEKGYQKYVDTRGQEYWLPPEEYEWRMRARKRSKHREYRAGTLEKKSTRILVLYGGLIVMAVLVGILLVRMKSG